MKCTDCINCKTEHILKDRSRRIACFVKPSETVYKHLRAGEASEELESGCPLYEEYSEGNFWTHVEDEKEFFSLLGKGNK